MRQRQHGRGSIYLRRLQAATRRHSEHDIRRRMGRWEASCAPVAPAWGILSRVTEVELSILYCGRYVHPPVDLVIVGASLPEGARAYILAHELGHWTGPRLGRLNMGGGFSQDPATALEEWTAELTALKVLARIGYPVPPRAAAGMGRCLASVYGHTDNPRKADQQSDEAVEYLLGRIG